MTPLETLKQLIVKEVPEIMELNFGCKVKNFLKGAAIILKVHTYEGESNCYDVAYYQLPELILERTPFNNWEILGRDITLEDVLKAIEKNHSSENEDVGHGVHSSGIFYSIDEFGEATGTGEMWNLGIPLHLQSEETVKFLLTILSK